MSVVQVYAPPTTSLSRLYQARVRLQEEVLLRRHAREARGGRPGSGVSLHQLPVLLPPVPRLRAPRGGVGRGTVRAVESIAEQRQRRRELRLQHRGGGRRSPL